MSGTQEYRRGRPVADLKRGEPTDEHGTTIEWMPDREIFETLELDFDLLVQRFREMAILVASTRIGVVDERTGRRMSFYFEGGTQSFVKLLTRRRTPLHPDPIGINGEVETTKIDIALQYCDTVAEQVLHVRQYHPQHQRRDAPDGISDGPHPHAQRIRAQTGHAQGQRCQLDRRGRARGSDGRD